MAVFPGARLRTIELPVRGGARPAARALPKASAPAAPRVRPTGMLMAAILTATMLGLVYLTQTLGSNATSMEINKLASDGQKLQSQLLNQKAKIESDANPDSIARKAGKIGLRRLDDRLVLRAP
jgi:hypothetical protein